MSLQMSHWRVFQVITCERFTGVSWNSPRPKENFFINLLLICFQISSINPNFVLAFDTLGYLVAFDTITYVNHIIRFIFRFG